MIASFFHDTPLIKSKDGKIYSQNFDYNVWERYLSVFDSLIVTTRMRYDDSNEQKIIKNLKLSSGRNVIFMPVTSYQKKIDIILNRKKIIDQIRKALQNSEYAIIRLPSIIGYIAYSEAKKLNKPFLVEVVGCTWDAYWNYSLLGKLVALPSYLYMRYAVKNAKYVIYVTNKFLQRRYPTKGIYTNCSNVFIKEINENILKKRLNKINDLNNKNKVILGTAAAVNVKYKGQQYVIRALGELKKRGVTNYEYQLVGEGNQSYLKSLAKKYNVGDQVKFLGQKRHDEVFNWMDSIDIYVQPSKQEGLPRALIEAMSRALPSIGANTAGIPELLDKRFIFSNKRDNYKEICNLLLNFDKEKLIDQAKRNFKESKKYKSDVIEKKRKEFLYMFKKNYLNLED